MPRLSKIGAAALAAFGWTGLASVSASYLVVAGGGSGGAGRRGAGGGAGGLLSSTLSLNPTLSYTVTVGAGGALNIAYQTSGSVDARGTNGSNSSFSTVTSTGGGGGGGGDSPYNLGYSGGSGGGGWSGAGGSGTSGQGYAGGTGTYLTSGGGGGSGSVGQDAPSTSVAGTGGTGTTVSAALGGGTYAGGGGGAVYDSTGAVGYAGGGTGNNSNPTHQSGTDATANTGSGGGAGGSGGSGIVIISYTAPQKFGGGVVTTSGSNVIHTFNTSGTLSPLSSLTASALVVAGGGGGGNAIGGGGGAGGYRTGSGLTIDTNSIYLVTVGAGGAGASNTSGTAYGSSGSNSVFNSITSAGGGVGGNSQGAGVQPGISGGSGGGGSNTGAGGSGNTPSTSPSQGNNGGAGVGTGVVGAGGGGGSSAVGSAGTSLAGGNGGAGTANSISGTSVTYAGGGGGGALTGTAGTGGAGGGGNATNSNTNGTDGTANTGGGGGGNGSPAGAPPFGTGGSGGSGVVIISYAGSTQQMAGGTVTITGGNVIHTFTSSGYLTPIKLVNNSLRFRSSANAYLNRTPATASNRKTWTWSAWVKRGTLSSGYPVLFQGGTTSSDTGSTAIAFGSNDKLYVQGYSTNWIVTNAVYRDPAAWYHIVLAMDSTQATGSNRLRLYVNGSEVSYGTYNNLTQNTDYGINQAASHVLAQSIASFGGNYFDGYMTEVNFVDGQQLTPNSFGTTNSYGVWQPITYGGSYGTNGFYLPFTNTTSTTTLGYDFSPNGNNWTPNNISLTAGSTYDSMTDVPTLTSATAANYAVWNPLDASSATTSNANLTLGYTTYTAWKRATIGVTSGKWYWEITPTSRASSNQYQIGIALSTADATNDPGIATGVYMYFSFNGNKYSNGSSSAYGASYDTNDVIGVAFDADAGTLVFYKNNTSQGTAFTGLTSGPYFPMAGYDAAGTWTQAANFGQRPFSYTPPTGFVALNTYNL